MKKCKLCGMDIKSEDDKHEGYCPGCAQKVIKKAELKEEIKREIAEEAKKKAEIEAKKKADEEKEKEKLKAEVRKEIEEELKKGIPGAPALPPDGAPAVHLGKKLSRDAQMIMDALETKNLPSTGLEIEYDMDIWKAEEMLFKIKRDRSEGKKADIDGASNYGAEFVPEEWATDFYMRLADLDGNLMQYFPKFPMTTNIKNIPEILGDVTIEAYSSYSAQNTAMENTTATSPTTDEGVLTARTFLGKTNVYDRVSKDEKFNLVRGLKQKLSMKLGSKISAAILNGDTTATHMDEDLETLGANIPEAMFKGLRKLTLAGSLGIDGDATYTLANLDSVRKKMGKYAIGANLRKSIWIVGVKTYNELMGLWRASSSTPQAADFVLKNGYIESYMGHPVVISEHQREDLEIDGYFDESGTAAAEGFLSLTNTTQFVIGMREKMSIIIVPDPLKRRRQIQGQILLDFQPFETPSVTISSIAGLYAYTLG